MKRTEIEYVKKNDGKIYVVGFKNVATRKDLFLEVGLAIYNEYINSGEYYFLSGSDKDQIIVRHPHSCYLYFIYKDCSYEPKEFYNRIQWIKNAGENLKKIKDNIANRKVQTIII